MPDSFARVNGKVFDHGSVILSILGERQEGFKAIKYDQKRNRTKVTGAGRHRRPKARTRGTYECGDVTITMLRRSAQDIRDAFAARSTDGISYGDPDGTIVVQYVEPGLAPVKDEFFKVVLVGDAGGTDDNADPLYEDVVFQPLWMRRNGKSLYGAQF